MKKLQGRIGQLETELSSTLAHFGKWKSEKMQAESEDLRSTLEEKDAQLVRLSHSMDKMKLELGQKEELMKQRDAELTRRSKEIQRLDEKIHRVDSLTSELLDAQEKKSYLETQLRDKEFELGQIKRQLQTAEDEKLTAKTAEQGMRERSENLKEQVRIEVERAAQLEERARYWEEAVAARARLQAEVDRLAGAAQDADLLVASARRVQRKLADQLASARAELQQLRAELAAARLDAESQAGGLRQQLAETAAEAERRGQVASGLRSLLAELKRQFPGAGPWIDERLAEARLVGGGGGSGGGGRGRLLNGRPISSAPRVRRHSGSDDGGVDGGSASASWSAVAEESGDNTVSASRTDTSRSNDISSRGQEPAGGGGRPHRRRGRGPASRQLRDRVADLYIHLGDRVTVRLMGGQGCQEAIVKHVGPGPAGPPSGKRGGTRYGLRLLSGAAVPGADAAAAAAAEFRSADLVVRASRIDAVFSRKTNTFRQLDSLINDYLETSK